MTEFVKADQAKARMDLLPPKVLEGVAQVLAFGAKKYAAWNWVKAPAYGRYFAAVQRHLAAWQAGEDLDPETGLPHLHHALCSLMFLAELQRLGEAQDDRPTDARLRAEIGPPAPRCARCCRPLPQEPGKMAWGPCPCGPPAAATPLLGDRWCEECRSAGYWHTDAKDAAGNKVSKRVVCHVCKGLGRLRADGSAVDPPTPAEVAAVGEAMPICQRCRYPLTVAGTTAGACEECGAPL